MFLSNRLDGGVFEQQWGILCVLHIKLNKAQRSKGRICRNGDTVILCILNQIRLGQVWVMLDLQSSGPDTGISEQVHDKLDVKVANSDAAGELLID